MPERTSEDGDVTGWQRGFEQGYERARAHAFQASPPPRARLPREDRSDGGQGSDDHGDGHHDKDGDGGSTSQNEDGSGRDDKKSEKDETVNDGKDAEKNTKRSKLPLIILAIVIVLAIIGGIIYWFSTRNLVTTDDAYTDGRAVTIAPRVSGNVVDLLVDDNTLVRRGDLMIKIDPRDYAATRDQDAANLELAKAQLTSAQLDLEIARIRYPAQLTAAEAQRQSAKAVQLRAQADYQRQKSVDIRATTQQDVDQASATAQSAQATLLYNQAQVALNNLIPQNVALAEATVKQREAQVSQAQAQLEQATVNLSYTEMRAPQDGRVTRRNVELGAYLQPGQSIFSLVTPEVWVTANFKEGQLNDIRPGQKVDIAVDAYPSLTLHGHIDSIQEGSGARFTAFPPENATGNYIKIVQRVPVKIDIDSGLNPNMQLPLGLSVEPTVTIR